ncbi:MAG: DUF4082 domain-containing protein [Propionicimonas sp.]|uniref:DUF4082 domain-containing protein n=1 Tax=Propionicimonas sp. TaxID=1955623 RepID=UPI002B218DE8|nr:DUF4082 domain-containing protein [Propionicimonas sp.]MEA4944766.1 DUF4082 domain-containing protein [Propionicimonas sp.]
MASIFVALMFSTSLLSSAPVASGASSASLFSSTTKPKTKAVEKKKSVNLGVRFSTKTDGTITGLRFYRSSKQKKAYTASLWGPDGKLLARATFKKSTKTGWQTARLSKPVKIKKGKTYTASYLDSNGRFAVTRSYFTKKRTKNGITVAKKGGVFSYSKKSKRPTSKTTANYLVDVVFVPKVTAPAPTPTPSTPPSKTPTTPNPPVASKPGASFSIAIIPDTQDEVYSASDPLYAERTQWLVANRTKLNLAYVLHTGDNVSFGWLAPSQYAVATKAIGKLRDAGIPYSLSIGNHDTRVVGWDDKPGSTGYGGSAYAQNPECPQRLGAAACDSSYLVRQTAEFNDAFPLSTWRNVGGVYEAGKVDNTWSTFTAAGTDWLVLNLELWPRRGVVDWAKKVVAAHPSYNVIIQTHHYLDGNGSISNSSGGYGETSPKYLYDQVVSQYSNVKFVFSGHTGAFTKRTDTINGNTVVSYLGNQVSGRADPVRVLTIDTSTGEVTGAVQNPIASTTIAAYNTRDKISVIK